MSATAVPVSPEWLALREPADAQARAVELVERLLPHLPTDGIEIHDLGGGSGAMARWLAPRLPGPQHWVVHDRDEDLLARAVAAPPPSATVEARPSDIARLTRRDLSPASLITASALLDLLTADELVRVLRAGAGRPMLLALTVVGRVALSPADPLDARIEAAFNHHQRRDGRLGPDAVAAVREAAPGRVLARPSPWRLDAGRRDLIAAWFDGWLAAACEQEPALAAGADDYRNRRLAQVAAGALAVTVDHADLLVLP
jgi:hypothetical protein